MLRFFIVALFLVLFLILSMPVYFVLYLIGKKNPIAKTNASQKVVGWAFRVILALSGASITVIGRENIPKDQNVLFVGNHRSYFDILVTYVNLERPTGYVAKKEMEKIPLLSLWMKGIHCLFLNREDIKEGLKTVLQGVEQIKTSASVFIFPEGTRSKSGEMLPFKEGSTKMAEKAGSPIVPVALVGTANLFEKNKPIGIKPAKVTLIFGTPIDPKALEKEQKKHLGAFLQNQIQTTLNEYSAPSKI